MLILLFSSTVENGGSLLVPRPTSTTRWLFIQPTIPPLTGLNILPARPSQATKVSRAPAAGCSTMTVACFALPRIVIPHTESKCGPLRSPNLQPQRTKSMRSASHPYSSPMAVHGTLQACTTLTRIASTAHGWPALMVSWTSSSHISWPESFRLLRLAALRLKFLKCGDPGRSRTCDLRFRKPSLYPSELQGHSIHFNP